MRAFIGLVLMFLLPVGLTHAAIEKYSCDAGGGDKRELEFDTTAKQARFWMHFEAGFSDGPYGPFEIEMHRYEYSWEIKKITTFMSLANYSFDRVRLVFYITILESEDGGDPYSTREVCKVLDVVK